MQITKENYGAYVIDYLDGNLSEKEQELLLHFLDQHPDLKEEVEELRSVSVSVPEVLFPHKEKLKHPEIISVASINESNYEEFLILSIDGELSADDTKALDLFLEKNPQLKEEKETFTKTQLIPDESIVFTNKASLKKRVTITPTRWIGAAAAAVIVLLLGWNFLIRKGENLPPDHLRNEMAVFEIQAKSVNLNQQNINPVILPSPKPERRARRPHANHPVYVRNPILIAQISARSVHAPMIPQMVPTLNLNQNILAGENPVLYANNDQKKKKRHPFLKLLEGGVQVVNLLTNKDMLLVKTYNQKGQLVHYQIISDDFNFDKKVSTAQR